MFVTSWAHELRKSDVGCEIGYPSIAIGRFTRPLSALRGWCPLSSTRPDLKEAIASYQKLIANYTLSRERMLVRRWGAPDHVMVELDEQIKINQRTIDALQRAIEAAGEQLKTMERG